jgi:hypothetical protein
MPSAQLLYVDRVLELYRRTPGTSGAVRRADRQLAASLYRRQVPAGLVAVALLVATARRTLRPADAPPLRPIATLYYFLPVIDELLADPLDPGYLDWLRYRLASLAPDFIAAIGHQLS